MKGISPLLASILLIAITVTVASIVSGWTTSTFSSSQSDVSNKTTAALSCSSSAITIDKVFIGAGDNGTASVVVRNSGSVDNVIVTSAQLYDRLGNNFSANNTLTLNVGQLGTLTFKMPHNSNVSADSSSNGNSGTCVDMTLNGISVCAFSLSGKHGGSISFDGSNDRVDYGTGFGTYPNFTVDVWANPSVFTPVSGGFATTEVVVGPTITVNGASNTEFVLGWANATIAQVFHSTQDTGFNGWATVNGSVSNALGGWHHIAFTYNNFTVPRANLYYDGVLVQTSHANKTIGASSSPWRLGSGYVSYFFNGKVDDVKIWNRTLSAAEVNLSMNGLEMDTSSLRSWLKFDGGQGVLSCPTDFSSVRVTTQCADATDTYTATPQC